MAVSAIDLVRKVRNQVGDWGAYSTTLSAQLASGAVEATLTAFDSAFIREGQTAEVETEVLQVIRVTNPVGVRRGLYGTTDATHVLGSTVIFQPRFTNQAILDALNDGLAAMNGIEPKLAEDVSKVVVQGQEEYDLPTGCLGIDRVELETSTAGLYRPFRLYEYLPTLGHIRVYGSPVIGRHIRIIYQVAYADLTWAATDISTTHPVRYHRYLVDYAQAELLSKEAVGKLSGSASADGIDSTYRDNLIAATTMRQQAMEKLEEARSPSRLIQLRDRRVYRL